MGKRISITILLLLLSMGLYTDSIEKEGRRVTVLVNTSSAALLLLLNTILIDPEFQIELTDNIDMDIKIGGLYFNPGFSTNPGDPWTLGTAAFIGPRFTFFERSNSTFETLNFFTTPRIGFGAIGDDKRVRYALLPNLELGFTLASNRDTSLNLGIGLVSVYEPFEGFYGFSYIYPTLNVSVGKSFSL